MEETRTAALELTSAVGARREPLLQDLFIMAQALRASSVRVLPGNLDVFDALRRQHSFMHPPIGLGNRGMATNLAGSMNEPERTDPILPSSYWNRPDHLAERDLYYGFGRNSLPNLQDIILTYRRSKQSLGVHGGFEAKCKEYGNVKLKFDEKYSQPFAHRICWALGFNTTPVDYVPMVKVKWDRRIFTEYNTHKDETLTIRLFGLFTIYEDHLQHYLDPLQPVSEIIMQDENGKLVTIKPNPNWETFKKQLYKNPKGRPETVKDNFNDSFADRVQALVYKNVCFQQSDDDEDKDETYLGNWDWNGEENQGKRELRAFAFVSAWINQYDSWAHNNKLYMSNQDGKRTFKHYITDLGGCLGPADNSAKMRPELPNKFPWTFTRPAKPGETKLPLNGSFQNIREIEPFKAADIYDAGWMATYIARLTGRQILEALIASGMPSAYVQVYYNKLVTRRNKALNDLGLDFPPITPMDPEQDFDYDPQKDGLISLVTSQNETVTAPDEDWVVLKGQVYTRAAIQSGTAARDIAREEKRRKAPKSEQK